MTAPVVAVNVCPRNDQSSALLICWSGGKFPPGIAMDRVGPAGLWSRSPAVDNAQFVGRRLRLRAGAAIRNTSATIGQLLRKFG